MNRYVKEFLRRGMMFGGFGPIIAGMIYLILEQTLPEFSLNGGEVCMGIVSTYVLAFLQAGASVFQQIDTWSPLRSLLCHCSVLYVAYVSCYLINTWIPFEPTVVLLFTAIFLVLYLLIYAIVVVSTRLISRKLNKTFR